MKLKKAYHTEEIPIIKILLATSLYRWGNHSLSLKFLNELRDEYKEDREVMSEIEFRSRRLESILN